MFVSRLPLAVDFASPDPPTAQTSKTTYASQPSSVRSRRISEYVTAFTFSCVDLGEWDAACAGLETERLGTVSRLGAFDRFDPMVDGEFHSGVPQVDQFVEEVEQQCFAVLRGHGHRKPIAGLVRNLVARRGREAVGYRAENPSSDSPVAETAISAV